MRRYDNLGAMKTGCSPFYTPMLKFPHQKIGDMKLLAAVPGKRAV
jgi:hypothetical protein